MNKEQDKSLEQSTSPSDVFGDDWQLLTEDWQEQPFKKSDIDKLLKQTKRRTLWAKAILWLNILATIFLVVMTVVFSQNEEIGTMTVVYFAVSSLLCIVFVYYEVKIRSKAWKKACDSPERALDNALRGCLSSLRYIKLIKIYYWLMIVLVGLFAKELSTELNISVWSIITEIYGMILVCYLVTHWFHRKRLAELKRLQQMK
ncbi:hypothetical protein [Thalassotalea fusca]